MGAKVRTPGAGGGAATEVQFRSAHHVSLPAGLAEEEAPCVCRRASAAAARDATIAPSRNGMPVPSHTGRHINNSSQADLPPGSTLAEEYGDRCQRC